MKIYSIAATGKRVAYMIGRSYREKARGYAVWNSGVLHVHNLTRLRNDKQVYVTGSVSVTTHFRRPQRVMQIESKAVHS